METRTVRVQIETERFELNAPFRISRGTKTHAEVVTVRLVDDDGRAASGECVPYERYGETVDGVMTALRDAVPVETSLERLRNASIRLGGAAKNALDTALHALMHPEQCAGALDDFDPHDGAGTLVLDTPERMAERAAAFRFTTLKMKLQGDGLDLERLRRVREARPELPLWLDANEGSTADSFARLLDDIVAGLGSSTRGSEPSASRPHGGVVLIEQPFPRGAEATNLMDGCPVPICADESFHGAPDVESIRLAGYRAVNVKLDKAGGLPSALRAARAAHEAGLVVVVGCMVSSSLSIAAAWTLVKTLQAEAIEVPFVDLDGATFLRADRSLVGTGWG